jgi:hypothetical protein
MREPVDQLKWLPGYGFYVFYRYLKYILEDEGNGIGKARR